MEEKVINNTLVSPEEDRQVNNVVEHVSEKILIGITGDLSSEDKEFCEKETKQIMDLLSPKQFARFVSKKLYLIDLYGAEEVGEIIVARLAMNRKPKTYDYTLTNLVSGNTGTLGSYLGTLKVTTERILLKVIPARLFLERGYIAVDDNGTSLTLLDPDLDRKLVVIDDLNLYFALQQDPSCFEDVWVEVISEFPKGRKWYY